jgi:hypothetical protein
MTSFYQYARNYPPILVRLLARKKNGPPLTTAQIAWLAAGYLTEYEVNNISQCTDWDSIPFGQMRAFLISCGMNFTDTVAMNRKKVYMKLPHKFHYLKKSPEWETVLKHLVARYREHIASKINQGK